MKVLFLTNIPSPYTTKFFNDLGNQVELTVIYERDNASDRDSDWSKTEKQNFRKIILRGIKVRKEQSISLGIIRHLSKKYDQIILGSFTTPTGIIAVLWMKLLRIKYMLFSEGGIPKNGKGFREKVKKLVIKKADRYLSTCELGDQYFIKYGAKSKNIRRIIFTTISEKDIVSNHDFIYKRKNKLPQIIAVGRFIKRKGFIHLIELSAKINSLYPHEVMIVGSGPEKKVYQKFISRNNLFNIRIIDYLPKQELLQYYRNSDIFVLPTELDTWGLVVIEAMTQGLPVITTDTCVSGTEFVGMDSGRLFKFGDDLNFQKYLIELLRDEKLRLDMSVNNYIKMRDYTFENMIIRFMDAISKEEVNK